MKKLLSLALVLALMLTLGVSAFAEVKVNGQQITAETTEVGEIQIEVSGDNVTATGNPWRVYAVGPDSPENLTVNGNVTGSAEKAEGSISCVSGATITVTGNATKSDQQQTIVIAATGGNVKVGGDATVPIDGDTVINVENSEVVVEGKVTGIIKSPESQIYLGQWDGDITGQENNIHYLIGFSDDSAKYKEEFSWDAKCNIDEAGIETASGKEYLTTILDIDGAFVIFKPMDNNKELSLESTLPEGVDFTTLDDGYVKLALNSNFKGGIQNLKLVLADKPGPGPDPDPVPVYYIVPTGSVTTASITLPDGVEEGLIKALDSADHAGLTIDKSLLAEGYDHDVKVTLGNEELPEGAYRFVINWDGSLSLILSTTYLKTLGEGSYDFTATVDDLVIPFTVVVAE